MINMESSFNLSLNLSETIAILLVGEFHNHIGI